MNVRTLISYEEALERLLAAVVPVSGCEMVGLGESSGRTAAETVPAKLDQPPFPRSPLDGYAVRSSDTASAGCCRKVLLRVTGTGYAGEPAGETVRSGEARRIMTGAIIPSGADAVIPQEKAERVSVEFIGVSEPVPAGGNCCRKGEDFRQGDVLAESGMRLSPFQMGILASGGYEKLRVYRRAVIGILPVGNELVRPGGVLGDGSIYDANGTAVCGAVRDLGGIPELEDPVEDSISGIAGKIGRMLDRCDLVVTTGGVSVGEKDYVPAVYETAGIAQLFHGVSMKPGSPVMAGVKSGKAVLSLPGNPFASATCFCLFGAPAVRKLSGMGNPLNRTAYAVLDREFRNHRKVRTFQRAFWRADGTVTVPEGNYSSGALYGGARYNCLLDLPPESCLHAGDMVRIISDFA